MISYVDDRHQHGNAAEKKETGRSASQGVIRKFLSKKTKKTKTRLMIWNMMIRSVCCSIVAEIWSTNSVMSVRVSYPRLIGVNHTALGLVMGVWERGFMQDLILGRQLETGYI